MKKRIELRISEDKKESFRLYCDKQGQSMSEVLLSYIDTCTDNKIPVRTESKENVRTNTKKNDIVRTEPKVVRTEDTNESLPAWKIKLLQQQEEKKAHKKAR